MLYSSCINKLDIEQETLKLTEIDREFSKYSDEQGSNEAFYKYCADDAVMLMNNSLPIKGKERLKEERFSQHDTNYKFIWEPLYCYVSKSCDLGYTYEIWTISIYGEDENDAIEGTYCSIWKKDKRGNWKWVLDIGNNGIANGQ